MSATEIIDQIKALEPQKQAKVLALLLEIEAAQKIACMDDERFDDAADRVLEQAKTFASLTFETHRLSRNLDLFVIMRRRIRITTLGRPARAPCQDVLAIRFSPKTGQRSLILSAGGSFPTGPRTPRLGSRLSMREARASILRALTEKYSRSGAA